MDRDTVHLNLLQDESLAAKLPDSDHEYHSWMVLYPRVIASKLELIRMKWVRIAQSELQQRNFDLDGDEDCIELIDDVRFPDLNHLEEYLSYHGFSLELFMFPFQCNLPF